MPRANFMVGHFYRSAAWSANAPLIRTPRGCGGVAVCERSGMQQSLRGARRAVVLRTQQSGGASHAGTSGRTGCAGSTAVATAAAGVGTAAGAARTAAAAGCRAGRTCQSAAGYRQCPGAAVQGRDRWTTGAAAGTAATAAAATTAAAAAGARQTAGVRPAVAAVATRPAGAAAGTTA